MRGIPDQTMLSALVTVGFLVVRESPAPNSHNLESEDVRKRNACWDAPLTQCDYSHLRWQL